MRIAGSTVDIDYDAATSAAAAAWARELMAKRSAELSA